jgi:3',5'-cyclic AMP phosphodiesterase CpdA
MARVASPEATEAHSGVVNQTEPLNRRRRAALPTLAFVLLARAAAAEQFAWVVLSPTGPVVRAVTDAPACPRAAAVGTADAVPESLGDPMTVRAEPALPDFPNRVCEWQPPPDARYVAVDGQPAALRMPAPNPRRIVVFGDSGCLGGSDQDCARHWYFSELARLAAARQPDLVVHLGDYNYRGTNCIAYDGCCTYNPNSCGFPNCGDTWPMWRADFFAPAVPLLAAAPWVMVRGNHDLCSRAGRGFHRYIDPHSPPGVCAANPVEDPTYTAPYVLYLGDLLRLLVLDSADACDEPSSRAADQIPAYRAQFAQLAELAATGTATQTWLLVHRPIWGILRDVGGRSTVLNYTLEQASQNRLPPSVSLVLSGHEHLFQSVTFEEQAMPAALLVGTGGTELDDPADTPEYVTHVPVGPQGPTIGAAMTVHDHGYLLVERSKGGWTAVFYDRYDRALATCDSSARPSICAPTPGG